MNKPKRNIHPRFRFAMQGNFHNYIITPMSPLFVRILVQGPVSKIIDGFVIQTLQNSLCSNFDDHYPTRSQIYT